LINFSVILLKLNYFFLLKIDAFSAMIRLDEFFAHDEIQPSVRFPNPQDSDETIIAVSKLEARNTPLTKQ
jgi:hypothetical protein